MTPENTDSTAEPTKQERSARFLLDGDGRVKFVLFVGGDPTWSFHADAFEVEAESLDEAMSALSGDDARWSWQAYLSAEPYASFYLKWDGCGHWTTGRPFAERTDDDPTIHVHHRGDWMNHLAFIEHVYTLAYTRHLADNPNCSDEAWYREDRQPLRSAYSDLLTMAEQTISAPWYDED